MHSFGGDPLIRSWVVIQGSTLATHQVSHATVSDLLPLTDGQITPQIDSVFDFGQLPEAKAKMEAGGHVGKIVLQMP